MNGTKDKQLLISARSFGRNDPRHMDTLNKLGFLIHELREGENAEPEEVDRLLPDIDAWIVSSYPIGTETLRHCKRLKVIVKHGVGVDNIDMDAASRHGVPVLNAPGTNHVPVADLAITHLLCFTRRIVQAHRSVQEGRWERFLGTGVYGKTLGIIGVGRIGRAIAERARGFGIRCIGFDPYQDAAHFLESGIVRCETLSGLLEESDFISINVPLTNTTRSIVSYDAISHMRNHALIINTSRGKVVDEAAICHALDKKLIGGYATDVYENEPPRDSPLLRYDNVLFTPHVASYTEDSMRSLGESVIEGIKDIFAGRFPENILNPDVLATIR